MKGLLFRVSILIFLSLLAMGLDTRKALALTDLCPAIVYDQHPVDESALAVKDVPAKDTQLYALLLDAHGPRTASGTITIQTDHGWFSVNFDKVSLARTIRTFSWVGFQAQYVTFVSPPVYVHFPMPVVIQNAWVSQAMSPDDQFFGWSTKGKVACAPTVPFDGSVNKSHDYDPTFSWKAVLAKTATPLEASASSAPFTYDPLCKPMNQFARAPRRETIVLPAALETTAFALVDFIVNTDGTVSDAWLVGRGGDSRFADPAVQGVMHLIFNPSLAYCLPAKTEYIQPIWANTNPVDEAGGSSVPDGSNVNAWQLFVP